EATWAEPVRLPYRGGEAASFPPPAQGFAALAILGLLEGFDLASLDAADLVHVTVEATKLAFEDRDRWLADPNVVDVPVAVALDRAHPNRLAPGKRTATTLIPSMYLTGGRPRFVYGTMGGEGQPQTQAALVARMVDHGLGPQAAVEAPRWLFGRTWGEPTKA